MLYVFSAVVILIILASATVTLFGGGLFNPYPAPQPAAVVEAVTTQPVATEFSAVGTLTFYPNNVRPVPYLFYQNGNGDTVSKALVFKDESSEKYSNWTGARVSVTGYVELEHVVVTSITHISGP
jgi:hypothetical protein